MSSLQDGRTLRCGLSTAATCVCAFAQSEHKYEWLRAFVLRACAFRELPKKGPSCVEAAVTRARAYGALSAMDVQPRIRRTLSARLLGRKAFAIIPDPSRGRQYVRDEYPIVLYYSCTYHDSTLYARAAACV